MAYTNVIKSIAFGLENKAMSGFSPSDFFKESLISRYVILESNGLRYAVFNKGSPVLFSESGPASPRISTGLKRGLLCVVVILPLVIIARGAYRRAKSKNTT
jgi:hypothetical protein